MSTHRRSGPHASPRYLEIESALREEIARLQPGDPLPSDAELCQRFGVSRMTARNGVQRLTDAGLVYRVPGQGTFVAEPTIHRRAGSLLSFSEDMRARGLAPHSRVITVERRPAEAREQAAFDLPAGGIVLVVERLRLANEWPMAAERTVLRPECDGVLQADLEHGSLHEALERLDRIPTVARGHIEPQAATARDAELLAIPLGAPLLVEQRTVFDQHEVAIEVTDTRYSPSRYVFDVELRRRD